MEALPSVTTWLSTAMEAYSQHLVSPAATINKAHTDTQSARAMAAVQPSADTTITALLSEVKNMIASQNRKRTPNQPNTRKRGGGKTKDPLKDTKTDDGKKTESPNKRIKSTKQTDDSWKQIPIFSKPPTNAFTLFVKTDGYSKHFCVLHRAWGNHSTYECRLLANRNPFDVIQDYFDETSKVYAHQAISVNGRTTPIIDNTSSKIGSHEPEPKFPDLNITTYDQYDWEKDPDF